MLFSAFWGRKYNSLASLSLQLTELTDFVDVFFLGYEPGNCPVKHNNTKNLTRFSCVSTPSLHSLYGKALAFYRTDSLPHPRWTSARCEKLTSIPSRTGFTLVNTLSLLQSNVNNYLVVMQGQTKFALVRTKMVFHKIWILLGRKIKCVMNTTIQANVSQFCPMKWIAMCEHSRIPIAYHANRV